VQDLNIDTGSRISIFVQTLSHGLKALGLIIYIAFYAHVCIYVVFNMFLVKSLYNYANKVSIFNGQHWEKKLSMVGEHDPDGSRHPIRIRQIQSLIY
jgi:hypothetical protein